MDEWNGFKSPYYSAYKTAVGKTAVGKPKYHRRGIFNKIEAQASLYMEAFIWMVSNDSVISLFNITHNEWTFNDYNYEIFLLWF